MLAEDVLALARMTAGEFRGNASTTSIALAEGYLEIFETYQKLQHLHEAVKIDQTPNDLRSEEWELESERRQLAVLRALKALE